MSYHLNEGDVVPEMTMSAWPEETLSFSALRGKWVVVYFYPRDNTPGCTTESCAFRDAVNEGLAEDVVVLGVSRDSLASHQRFTDKQELNFPLISDADEALCSAFDVIQMKNMYGKQVRGVERSTFIIDPEGVVRHIWRKVRVKGHVEAVMEQLNTLHG